MSERFRFGAVWEGAFARRVLLHLLDGVMLVVPAGLIAATLGIPFLLSGNLPTGGDTASHLLYVWLYVHELLPNGYLTAWMPEVFAGFPFLSYYFPLPFITIAGLASLTSFGIAMKLGMFAAAMGLPGAVWLGSVYLLRLPRGVAVWGCLASLAFLLHEQHSIWGGNLLSTLSGEFAYSYGMFFSVLTLFAWQRVMRTGSQWWLVALLEAATGFSHGFALLLTGFATAAFLFDRQRFVRNLRLLLLGHGLAFLLLAGWLWPMMAMHGLTIPNDALFEIKGWQDLLPPSLQPVLAAGVLATMGLLVLGNVPACRRRWPLSPAVQYSLRQAGFMAGAALLAGVGFLAGSRLGLANIRFFPFVWLWGGVACAWVWGGFLLQLSSAGSALVRWAMAMLGVSAALGLLAWVSLHIVAAPDWGLWNHSGLEPKPQWQQLRRLFPVLKGDLSSPRLLFEHDPANNDLGSTRTLEALPMFLGGRPVLEGLYMESALAGPAVYQLQSEVSSQPSSPLARFPSGSLDLDMAAQHMRMMYANEVLVRHPNTRRAFSASALFEEQARAEPFAVYRLKDFTSKMVDLVDKPLRWQAKTDWMEASFQWFRSPQGFVAEIPVFDDGPMPDLRPVPAKARVHDFKLERNQISWRTDAVGAPHLVRMAWHTRWQLATRGSLHLAGPGFMLVIPGEAEVRLVYGHTRMGVAGMWASGLAVLVLLWLAWCDVRRSAWICTNLRAKTHAHAQSIWPSDRLSFFWPALLMGLALWLYSHDPERLYANAWVKMRSSQHVQAAQLFDDAYAERRGDAKQEEALFWAAKAYEQAGMRDEALTRYVRLTSGYHGYWLPEALYLQWQLARAKGLAAQADEARERLLREFPANRWAQRVQ